MPDPTNVTGEAPVWARVTGPDTIREDAPGYLEPQVVDIRSVLNTVSISLVWLMFEEQPNNHRPLRLKITTAHPTGSLETWLARHLIFDSTLLSTPTFVHVQFTDSCRAWEWLSANRFGDIVGFFWPSMFSLDNPMSVDSLDTFPGIAPELRKNIVATMAAVSKLGGEWALQAGAGDYGWVDFDLAGFMVGSKAGEPLLTMARALAYRAAGVGATEAHLFEFGGAQDPPTLEALTSLAALRQAPL